jgi:transcriptional regulator with XRE-family HTH domain
MTRLKFLLEERGLKQIWLALKTGIPENRMSEYVTGRRIPRAGDARRIADALGVKKEYLWGTNPEGNVQLLEGKAEKSQ